MKCGQGARGSSSLLRNRNTGQYGAANDSLLPACGSLIKVMQNSLLMTLIAEFGHEMKNICGVNDKLGSSVLSTGAAGRAQSSPSCCVERGLDTMASHLGASNSPLLPATLLFPNTEHPTWGLYFHKEPSERIVDDVHFKAVGRGRGSWTLFSPTE